MRLLNVESLELVDFNESSTPPYIAISHTWDSEELTFADWHKPAREKRAGFAKVRDAAVVVKKNGETFMWIDTCCIDKSSSAELSEAINSMFKWYAAAQACYVFMADVTISYTASSLSEKSPDNWRWTCWDSDSAERFRDSRWFTRGWTLQELVAPKDVIFYSSDWEMIGTKLEMASIIAKITRIQPGVLQRTQELSYVSVAGRMSWASQRITTRTEDLAYCLLGIFGVNMPLLYGEGEKAFIRLQEQIMREIDDQSLFAWADCNADPEALCGMLATHPKFFRDFGQCLALNEIPAPGEYTLTNKAALDCTYTESDSHFVAVILKSVSATESEYCRVDTHRVSFALGLGKRSQIFVRQNLLKDGAYRNMRRIKLGKLHVGEPVQLVEIDVPSALRGAAFSTSSKPQWIPNNFPNGFGLLRTPGSVAVMLKFRFETGHMIVLCLGRGAAGALACHVATSDLVIAPSQLEFGPTKDIVSLANGSYIYASAEIMIDRQHLFCDQVNISLERLQDSSARR